MQSQHVIVGIGLVVILTQFFVIIKISLTSTNAPTSGKHMHVVVASFGKYSDDERVENLTWIPLSRSDSAIFLYQRHDPSSPHFIATRNGYECLTYVHHIVAHYNSLPDLVVFIHADAPRHCPGITALLSQSALHWDQELRSSTRSIHGYLPLSRIALNMTKQHLDLFNFPLLSYTRDILTRCTSCPWHSSDVPQSYPPFITTYIAGSFAVSRDNILRYPLSFWEEWRSVLSSSPAHDRVCGSLELIWTSVWGGQPFVTPIDPSRQCGALFYTDITPLEGFVFVRDEDGSLKRGHLPAGYNGHIRLQSG